MRIVYSHGTGGDAESQLRRINLDGTGDAPLTPGPGWSTAGVGDFWPEVSPDGSRVVFVSGSTEPYDDVALVSINGGNPRQLAPDSPGHPLWDGNPTWKPR